MFSTFIERAEALGAVTGWFFVLLVLVSFPLSWLGVFLSLRKQVFMGDAMSHSILPGIVIGFLFVGNLDSVWLQIGAVLAAIAAAVGVEFIQENNRIKQDAAIGIVFATLFSLGVFLLSWMDHVDLDPECVIHGQMELLVLELLDAEVGIPAVVWKQLIIGLAVMGVVFGAFFSLTTSAFDLGHARTMGVPTRVLRYGLLILLAVTLVSSFPLVGAILPIAILVLPSATVAMWTSRLVWRLVGVLCLGVLAAALTLFFALTFDLNMAGVLVSVHFAFFLISLVIGKNDGFLKSSGFYGKSSSRVIGRR